MTEHNIRLTVNHALKHAGEGKLHEWLDKRLGNKDFEVPKKRYVVSHWNDWKGHWHWRKCVKCASHRPWRNNDNERCWRHQWSATWRIRLRGTSGTVARGKRWTRLNRPALEGSVKENQSTKPVDIHTGDFRRKNNSRSGTRNNRHMHTNNIGKEQAP